MVSHNKLGINISDKNTTDKRERSKNLHLNDRNFDPIADHFENKVYGGLKGEIRLAILRRDITEVVLDLSQKYQRPLRVLDVGAGLAQISLDLAEHGHHVTINDISENMIAKAKAQASSIQSIPLDKKRSLDSSLDVTWHVCPYQALEEKLDTKYDLIMCHALLEWLGQPKEVIGFFKRWLDKEGVLSLCFYNPASFVYRNLIMGNFNLLNNPNYKADNKKSLTPNNPVQYADVASWLDGIDFSISKVSGLRVFHDYTPLKRGGLNDPKAVIEMELRYSTQDPYRWLGRYLHVIASPTTTAIT